MDPELQACTEHDVHYNSVQYTSLESKTLETIIWTPGIIVLTSLTDCLTILEIAYLTFSTRIILS